MAKRAKKKSGTRRASAEELRNAKLEMWMGRLGFPVFCVGTVWALVGGTFGYLSAKESLEWPTTQGIIQTSEVTSGTTFLRRLGLRKSYAPKISYTYSVEGQEYTGHRIDLTSNSGSSSEQEATTLARRYGVGTSVRVRYDPQSPADCALSVGTGLSTYIPLIIGAIGVILCPLSWMMWTDGRRKLHSLQTTGRLPPKSWADRLPEFEISNKLVYALLAAGVVIYGVIHAVFFPG